MNTKNWFNGSVLSYSVECKENPEYCGTNVKLLSPVTRDTSFEKYKSTIDMM